MRVVAGEEGVAGALHGGPAEAVRDEEFLVELVVLGVKIGVDVGVLFCGEMGELMGVEI